MTALPMTLEEALRHEGYTIDAAPRNAFDITLPEGTIHVPSMVLSALTWRRDEPPTPGDDLYLSSLPMFSELYRPVLLSSILDRFRTRRLGYDTPGQWRLAFRRWGNLNMTIPNRRYASTAVALELDDRDALDEITDHDLAVGSDFPQSLVSGSSDYASDASDRRHAGNIHRTGRVSSVMELLERQRAAFVNVDAEVVEALESLFLGVFDQGESRQYGYYGPPPTRYGLGGSLYPWGW